MVCQKQSIGWSLETNRVTVRGPICYQQQTWLTTRDLVNELNLIDLAEFIRAEHSDGRKLPNRRHSTNNDLANILQISWNLSCSYFPRTTGLAEKLVGSMKACLISIEDFSLNSIFKLSLIQFFHNTSHIGMVRKEFLDSFG
jgi:hypothetical protein